MKKQYKKVLICRTGSLGDTVVALPALRVIANAFPEAERWLLRKDYGSNNIVSQAAVLEGTGLINEYMTYKLHSRLQLRPAFSLMKRIRAQSFDAIVYLTMGREPIRRVLANVFFFRLCGVRRIIGASLRKDLRISSPIGPGQYEYECTRLLRNIRELGTIDLGAPEACDLKLSNLEREAASAALAALSGPPHPIIALSIGAKLHLQQWGNQKWHCLVEALNTYSNRVDLALVGGLGDRECSTKLLRAWRGSGINLCGDLSVRQSAAVLERAALFVGQDSGPMHLAAAVGTPCVAVFSSHDYPGEWFPLGSHHRVLYRNIDCQGCHLKVCVERHEACIRSITVNEVYQAVTGALHTLLA